MTRTTLILALLSCFMFTAACGEKKDEPAAEAEATDEAKDDEKDDEAKDEEKDDEAKDEEKDDEAKDEEKDDEAKDDEKKDDEAANKDGESDEKKSFEAGKMHLDFPIVATTAKADEFVLAPSRSFLDKAAESKNATFIYYTSKVLEAGEKESKLKSLTGKEETLPNSLIVPLPKGGKAKPGDIVLTWWQSGSGMQRAIVVGGSETEPVVRYLDLKLDNPSGIATREDTLKPDSFIKLSDGLKVGATVACKKNGKHTRSILTSMSGDKLLTIGFAGKMAVHDKGNCVALGLNPDVKVGDKVMAPYIGTFREVTVSKIDARNGRIFGKFQFGGKDQEVGFARMDVAKSLGSGAESASAGGSDVPPTTTPTTPSGSSTVLTPGNVDPKTLNDPDPIKTKNRIADGSYRGSITGGASGQIVISVRGGKVSGNMKGLRNGEKWLTGLSGSSKSGTVTARGSNKNTNLSITGKANGKKITGSITGTINGKSASMSFSATR